ncbi:MAG: PAS domain-containing protein [Actinomycetota bacterium]|nr:PAS domain-containing protein [Actinomycetota bacterium]
MASKKEKKGTKKDEHIDTKVKNILFNRSEEFNLFQKLINNIPDNIYIKDKKNRFLIVNKTMAGFLGKNPGDFIGKTDADLFPGKSAKEYSRDENKVMKTGKPIIDKEEKLIYSGKEYWMSSSKIPWYDSKGSVMGTMGISRNITKRKREYGSRLGREKSFFNALMDNISESIFFKDLDSRFVRINKATAEKFGLDSPEDAVGKTDFDIFSEEHARQAFKDEQLIIKTGNPIINLEEKETYEDKSDRWASTSKIPWHDENNNIIGVFGITRDITERKNSEEKIRYLSFHDTLTGLYNRAYFEEEIKRLNTERQLPLTMLMGDVNGLKVINDAYGHLKGDIFLKKIADILKECFREEDIVSRWGGDEFIIMLPKTPGEYAKNILKRIKKLCRERSTENLPLSISFGYATKKSPSEDIDKVLKEAEDKMYKNKIADSKSTNEIIISSLKENLRKEGSKSEKQSIKLRKYALAVGRRLNLTKERIEELKLLMDVYNIGKLALADEIMSKPGRLTRDEWKIIKKLPEIGYRIAESSNTLKPISEAILSHYEWYNGSGYPRGIKGDEIPILSRISFLINSYEAMAKDRPYRKKLTKRQIIKEIKKYSGLQFDPKVSNIFLELLEEDLNK